MAAIAPLTGIKVIDLTKLAPGPHCTMILGDLGADIIKVEEPGAPTGRRAEQAGPAGVSRPSGRAVPTNALARNKRSIGLNLKSAFGKEAFLKLTDARRRRRRGVSSRRRQAARHRLRNASEAQSQAHLLRRDRLRPDGTIS